MKMIISFSVFFSRPSVVRYLLYSSETIPPKVTINEYIDLAKDYSTPQSGQFVNGILDNIHKELLAAQKIHKIDFRNKA